MKDETTGGHLANRLGYPPEEHVPEGDALDGLGWDAAPPAEADEAERPTFVDWREFWRADRQPEWLEEDVFAKGRAHTIYAKHKDGKSLYTLWVSVKLARAGVLVVYLDYEMTEDDLAERLTDMGVGPDTALSLLRYALLPSVPPLDTPEGGDALLAIVDREREAHPGRDTFVVIDTIGRAVQGDENPADTIRAFYRCTGMALKQRGVTWVRLDHSGKDAAKGARGSSAKGDDVDVVWHLVKTDSGIELHRDAARIGWAPEKVVLNLVSEPELRFVAVTEGWPAGTYETAKALDRLGVPPDAPVKAAVEALRADGSGRRTAVVSAAQKYRRQARIHRETPRETPSTDPPATPRETLERTP